MLFYLISTRDVALAKTVPIEDVVVDDLVNHTYRRLLKCAMEIPDSLEQTNILERVAYNLERAVDRVINVRRWVVYSVGKVYVEMDSELELDPS